MAFKLFDEESAMAPYNQLAPRVQARIATGATTNEGQARVIDRYRMQEEDARRFDEGQRTQRENTINQFLEPARVKGGFDLLTEQARGRAENRTAQIKADADERARRFEIEQQPKFDVTPRGDLADRRAGEFKQPPAAEQKPSKPVYDAAGNLLYVEQGDGQVVFPRPATSGLFDNTAPTPAAPVPGAAPATAADPLEGRTATGPNGQKLIRRNGQWVPM